MKLATSLAALASREVAPKRLTHLLWLLMLVIYVLVVAHVLLVGTLLWSVKMLLLVFLLLPPFLCFLLVDTYTQMILDERANALREAWSRCQMEFLHSEEYRALVARGEGTGALGGEEAERQRGLFDGMREFVVRRYPPLAELFTRVRAGEEARLVAREQARAEIRTAGLDNDAYNLPILFFSFGYLAGLIMVFPLLEAYSAQEPVWPSLRLAQDISVPLWVMQVGFLGGGAFAAYNLTSRFLSRDIAPRLFLVSGVRLLLAPLGASLLYLVAPDSATLPGIGIELPMRESGTAAVLYLVAGGFPFALLGAQADNLLSRLDFFKKRLMAGKRSTTLVEGITAYTAQRLSEEGIEVIQHLAFCDPPDLARRTRFSEATVTDWRDQAILYLLTGDSTVSERPDAAKGEPVLLFDLLDQRAGIRTMSALLRRIFTVAAVDGQGQVDRRGGGLQLRDDIEAFFRELGLVTAPDEAGRRRRIEDLTFLFARLCEDALAIDPGLRRVRRPRPSMAPAPAEVPAPLTP